MVGRWPSRGPCCVAGRVEGVARRSVYCSAPGIGVWRSPVAHLLWEQGVGGSNPLTPTTYNARHVTVMRILCG